MTWKNVAALEDEDNKAQEKLRVRKKQLQKVMEQKYPEVLEFLKLNKLV